MVDNSQGRLAWNWWVSWRSNGEYCLEPVVLRSEPVVELGLKPVSYTSESLVAQYLQVAIAYLKQLIMQTAHIIQLDSSGTDSLPKGEFLQDNPIYFLITLPGSSTATPPYQWRPE
jgi:hypothetical protein